MVLHMLNGLILLGLLAVIAGIVYSLGGEEEDSFFAEQEHGG